MSEGYKKLTKEDIDFPRYCLFFIKKLQEAIDGKELEKHKFLEIVIDSTYPYCSDALELVIKTFERKGLDIMIPTFKLEYKFTIKHYIYKWKLKIHSYDGLPF
jgi:hypothetical protein